MAILTSLWFIIEVVIIPDGFVKWFYLSFYIHPFFLILCQLFLWLKLLSRWILCVTFYPARIICFVGLFVFRFFRDSVLYIFSTSRVADAEVITEEVEKSLVLLSCNLRNEIGNSYGTFSSVAPEPCMLKAFEFQETELVEDIEFLEFDVLPEEEEINTDEQSSSPDTDMGVNEDISSNICHSKSLTEDVDDLEEELDSSPSFCSSNLPAADGENLDMNTEYYPPSEVLCISSTSPDGEREEILHGENEQHQEEISDAFYKKYTERMNWFDLLNYDRTCGISAVMKKELGTPSSFESNKPVVISTTPYISWTYQTKKRLLRSLESDFERVYVAQSCLSWEALHCQYTKIKTLADSTFQTGVFYGNIFEEFQKFQVLLERFLENERCEGKRIWNYVRGRFALKSLLQVPQISGFSEEEKERVKGEASTSVKEVLKAIEKCIDAFGIFVTTDNKKPVWWKLQNSLWTCPPVEDPRDLGLLRYLTRQLRKKEIRLKDLQGKQRCWFKRVVNPVEESQRKEILFTMIDMKLVSRVIQMSAVSSSQLKWCQEKLDNIEFKEGKVFRNSTAPLFPP